MSENKCILQVEDDENDQALFQFAFKNLKSDFSVCVVKDGEEAIAYISGSGQFADRQRYPLPSMVLLDLKMPRKSGFEVLEWLHTQRLHIPVIVFTASNNPGDVRRAYELGTSGYIVKPNDFAAWSDLVRRLEAWWLRLNVFAEPLGQS